MTFEQLLMEHGDSLSLNEKTHLEILSRRFDNNSPFRPGRCFNLNLSTAISTAGLVATYLVILLQFKQSDIDLNLQG